MGLGRTGETMTKFAMSGCHDTTLAGVLSSLGAFDRESWPPFTSHIELELFRKKDQPRIPEGPRPKSATEKQAVAASARPGWFASLLGLSSANSINSNPLDSTEASEGIGRRPTAELSSAEKAKLNGYYVRIRYNDRVMTIPGCKRAGNHLEGDETFCTMAAFKAITDEYTPRNWKQECDANMDTDAIKPVGKEEWAGYSGTGEPSGAASSHPAQTL